jgi:hypothetical protein
LQKFSQEEFSKLAVDGAEVDDLLIGEVGVKDFGDNENEDIAERFGAKKEEFPGFLKLNWKGLPILPNERKSKVILKLSNELVSFCQKQKLPFWFALF